MRIPVIPTIVVGAACVVMLALGVWQLQRAGEKRAIVQLYAQNNANPEEVAYPLTGPLADEFRFRRSMLMCLEVAGWRQIGGTAEGGRSGFRQIAECRTGAEGPTALVDIGVSYDPAAQPDWRGGPVRGRIAQLPDETGLIGRLAGQAPPPQAILVAEAPAPGLERSTPPDPADLPDNHIAYAVQWFLFALAAAVIYWLALRRRNRAVAGSKADQGAAQG